VQPRAKYFPINLNRVSKNMAREIPLFSRPEISEKENSYNGLVSEILKEAWARYLSIFCTLR
jgi:hypothetical protein